YAQTIDHRRVGVRADEGVRIGHGFPILVRDEHGFSEVLEIHLMADTGARGDHTEILERVLPPSEKDVAFLIALELELRVDQKRGLAAVLVDLHRVINDEVNGLEWVDALGIAA